MRNAMDGAFMRSITLFFLLQELQVMKMIIIVIIVIIVIIIIIIIIKRNKVVGLV